MEYRISGEHTSTLSLLELNSLVGRVVEQALNRDYWVEAELSECRESRGHCYMELIQKDPRSTTPVARAQARCWQSTWAMLRPYFERTTGQVLRAGLKVRLKVRAQFHPAYGFAWIVNDIDPDYTLGDMARRRQEIIRQLREEGIFDMQKELALPPFCLRIAVVSSATAAGYGDFAAQLADSPYRFETTLFPAIMQGEQVEESVIRALERIYEAPPSPPEGGTIAPACNTIVAPSGAEGGARSGAEGGAFDCVVIIRGGGATADLSGFDTLALAENVAQFPLPIITGIGHDRDESVLDMVSCIRVKTPTAAAQHLITHAQRTHERITMAEERLTAYAQNCLTMEQMRLTRLAERIPPLFSVVRSRQEARLDSALQRLTAAMSRRIDREQQRMETVAMRLQTVNTQRLANERHRLEMLEQRTKALDPTLLLRRGYSITTLNGRLLRDPAEAQPGDELVTRLERGLVHSRVSAATAEGPSAV